MSTQIDPAAIVAFWPSGTADDAVSTLRSVLAGAPAPTPVALPGGWERLRALTDSERARINIVGRVELGLARFLELAAGIDPGADLALVADAGELPPAWLDRTLAAAHSDDSVSASTTRAVGGREAPFASLEPTGAPHAGSCPPTADPPAPPRVVTPWPHCTVIRRTALALVGGLDATFTHPAVLLADFAARARGRGMTCVLVSEIAVKRFESGLESAPGHELAALGQRHPWLAAAQTDEAALEVGPLRHSLLAARASAYRPSVTVDARALSTGVGGTQTYVAALVIALARSGRLSVRAVVAGDTDPRATEALAAAGAEVLGYEQAVAGVSRTDLVHRPQQAFTPSDVRLLRLLGERIVISHMDLIAYHAPSYHASVDDWRSYRRTTRLALACADRALFFSEHARRDAISDELIPPDRAAVIGVGVEAAPAIADGDGDRPARVPRDRDLLLLLGSDYSHKNRPFAMELVDELRRRHGWDGLLVMAGPHVSHGSSADAEAELLGARPELAARVLDLGAVSEAEKRWLMRAAVAHLFTSSYEGFGLSPLEAAAAGRPCIFAPVTSLAEIVDRRAATIVPWDARASAAEAGALLTPGPERDRHLALLGAALRRHAWPAVTEQILVAYAATLASPYRAAAPRGWEELEREQLVIDLDSAYRDLRARTNNGIALIDASGSLLSRAEQRGLMRVAARPWLRGPLLGGFALLGRDHPDPPLGDDRRG